MTGNRRDGPGGSGFTLRHESEKSPSDVMLMTDMKIVVAWFDSHQWD